MSKPKNNHLRVQIDPTALPNQLHFDVQRRYRGTQTRNGKAYSRKLKHKTRLYQWTRSKFYAIIII